MQESGRTQLNAGFGGNGSASIPALDFSAEKREEGRSGDAPGGARTPSLLIRSQMLYPIELQALTEKIAE
jgi:hypothetical protein